jgi:hypothetical protein
MYHTLDCRRTEYRPTARAHDAADRKLQGIGNTRFKSVTGARRPAETRVLRGLKNTDHKVRYFLEMPPKILFYKFLFFYVDYPQNSPSNLLTVTARLYRRTRHVAIRAKHATVAGPWLQNDAAAFAVVEVLAGIRRHALF